MTFYSEFCATKTTTINWILCYFCLIDFSRFIVASQMNDAISSQSTSHDQSNRESQYNPAMENDGDSIRD